MARAISLRGSQRWRTTPRTIACFNIPRTAKPSPRGEASGALLCHCKGPNVLIFRGTRYPQLQVPTLGKQRGRTGSIQHTWSRNFQGNLTWSVGSLSVARHRQNVQNSCQTPVLVGNRERYAGLDFDTRNITIKTMRSTPSAKNDRARSLGKPVTWSIVR
ncbi:predicted protein [Coccidioides posadasii str. Silveira]|uniref:Predicted protein n=1 Tax=Coccidioides posadasii (strain RMSCC 757 / Silveira) TaxID=443226 RepID=E9D528_COCPS|nr:predicted protein [Coccidioides posadasii str. Silveira]